MNDKKLWYIADPMCSWCWGFAPVIEKIHKRYSDRLNFGLMLGGLRPGTKQPIAPTLREEILHHWHNVQHMTGQPFQFDGALPEGFIYDTEIACRSVISVSMIDTAATLSFFMSIQQAFYAEQMDVTKPAILAKLAADSGINQQSFLQVFESSAAKKETSVHFQQVHSWGINGFPSIVLQNASGYHLLAIGYCPAERLFQRLDVWLKT